MKIKITIIAILLIGVALCFMLYRGSIEHQQDVDKYTFSFALAKSINIETPASPFEWTKSKKQQLIARLKAVKTGDSLSEVARLLGPPYGVDVLVPKENEKVKGIHVTYYLKKQQDFAVHAEDQAIHLGFDPAGHFLYMDLQGIELAGIQNGEQLETMLQHPDQR